MRQDIIERVRKCDSCQKYKALKHKYGHLQSIPVGKPGEVWAADIAIFHQTSEKGNKYMLVMMEYLTKWVITAALTGFTTTDVANAMLFQLILIFNQPKRLITDNATNFISEAMRAICERLGIARTTTSVERPQVDGLVEKMNSTIKTALAPYTAQFPKQWDAFLPFITFGINTAQQASSGFSPFELMFGRIATLPTTARMEPPPISNHNTQPWIAYLNHYLPIIHEQAKKNINTAQIRQQKYYNKGRLPERKYKVGEQVLKVIPVESRHFPKPKFSGPWKIIKIGINKHTYTLQMKVKNQYTTTTANQAQLEPYYQ
ncbi:hypothetical protein INT45_008601 [Circinella minor]|uniref:Integrase catalytic domain-containing protein n=1 Tax=Circinella minor TaxID=1195481 RepID=A0A8H7VGL9_9FUNG|nr:hypothetical protein INT45_008601 [Circinella minor]